MEGDKSLGTKTVFSTIIASLLFHSDWVGAKGVEAKSPTAVPVGGFCDSVHVRSIDDLLESRNAVALCLFAEFNPNPSPTHFMGHCSRGTRPEK